MIGYGREAREGLGRVDDDAIAWQDVEVAADAGDPAVADDDRVALRRHLVGRLLDRALAADVDDASEVENEKDDRLAAHELVVLGVDGIVLGGELVALLPPDLDVVRVEVALRLRPPEEPDELARVDADARELGEDAVAKRARRLPRPSANGRHDLARLELRARGGGAAPEEHARAGVATPGRENERESRAQDRSTGRHPASMVIRGSEAPLCVLLR